MRVSISSFLVSDNLTNVTLYHILNRIKNDISRYGRVRTAKKTLSSVKAIITLAKTVNINFFRTLEAN